MIVQHGIKYFLGKAIPGVVSLCSMALFTRILSPEEYGKYALILATGSCISTICFQWLILSMGRFLTPDVHNRQSILSTALFSFLSIVIFTSLFGLAFQIVATGRFSVIVILLSFLLGWSQSWFDLNLKALNSSLQPTKYGIVGSVKSVLSLGVSVALLMFGFGCPGIIAATIFGIAISTCISLNIWKSASIKSYDPRLLREFAKYGLSLTLTFLVSMIVSISDRFFLGYFINASAVGLYSAPYDFADQTLGLLLSVVHLAAFPLTVRALEKEGADAARVQLRKNLLMQLFISAPCTILFIVLSGNLSHVVFGSHFQIGTDRIIAIVSVAAFVRGLHSYYLDYSFQLSRHMKMQAIPLICAAFVNIGLNLFFIPSFGAVAAAYSTLIAYFVSAVVCWLLGRKVFALPRLSLDGMKIIFAASVMGVSLYCLSHGRGIGNLMVQVVLGFAIYLVMLVAFNVCGVSARLKRNFIAFCHEKI